MCIALFRITERKTWKLIWTGGLLIEKAMAARWRMTPKKDIFFMATNANPPSGPCDTPEAAKDSGADVLCLCDTNGERCPCAVEVLEDVRKRFDGILGSTRFPHNDSELAVANALVAVEAGVTHVQGCINGLWR